VRPIPPRRPHPADQGPPLEDLDLLVRRAEERAEREWIDEHGALPGQPPPATRPRPSPAMLVSW